MEHDEDDNEEYSKDLKEFILLNVAKTGPNQVQLLEDMVKRIKYEQQ